MLRESDRRKGYWESELQSLGFKLKRMNSMNDVGELAALTENIKQAYFRDYKSAYGRNRQSRRSHFGYIT